MFHTLRTAVRAYLGTDAIPRMETAMANAATQLTDLKTAIVDYNADVDAKLDQLLAAQGDLTPDAQVIFDDLKATVAAADAKVGDADGSDTPVEPAPPVEDTEEL
jgi:hypothetical protein